MAKRVDGVGVSSSSQPAITAIMLEQLEVKPGQLVLEIGPLLETTSRYSHTSSGLRAR